MKFKNIFKRGIRKRMWSNLKYQIQTIRSLLNELGVLKSFNGNGHQLTANHAKNKIEASFFTTAADVEKPLRLVTVQAGISKHLTRPILKKGIIGEDAWFIESKTNVDVLGVADGVGGWSEIGVDPSKFSSNLMKQCKRYVQLTFNKSTPIDINTPVRILADSFTNLIERKDHNLIGSSTACILLFNQLNSCMYAANLGDSGFVVVRNNEIVHRSVEQQHYFNCPFQLAILPGEQENLLMQDKPESANLSEFKLKEGDLIVLATDGLWDNLNEITLLNNLSELKSFKSDELEKVAKKIVDKTVRLSRDPLYYSPFAMSARQNQISMTGGKPDDITLLLARVSK